MAASSCIGGYSITNEELLSPVNVAPVADAADEDAGRLQLKLVDDTVIPDPV
jgi:hypothetical protein